MPRTRGSTCWTTAFLVLVWGSPAAAQAVDSVALRALRGHLEFLASDVLRGRGSGTRDELIAASYVAAVLRAEGIVPAGDSGGFIQTIRMVRPALAGPPTLSVGDTHWTHGGAIAVVSLDRATARGPLGRSATPTPGAFVLMSPDSTASQRTLFAEAARLRGAGAAVVLVPAPPTIISRWEAISANFRGLPPRYADVADTSASRATVVLLNPTAMAALNGMPDGTELTLAVPLGAVDTTFTWNVVGVLPGRDPDAAGEVVMLSAHYDHVGVRAPVAGDSIYNGADDDASGTAAVLELARRLAVGPRPRRTLLFALFGSEETGGTGSDYYLARPPVPLARHVAQVQFEMLGRPDSAVTPGTLWLTGYERSTLGSMLAGFGARLVADPHPAENFFQRSDNYRFARRGIVAHTVSSFGLHADYHRPSDEVSRIDFSHLTRAVSSLVEPIRRLADTTARPTWNPGGRP